MKTKFQKLNADLFSNTSIKMEKMSAIRGGRNCTVKTIHGNHTHKDTISNDDDMGLLA